MASLPPDSTARVKVFYSVCGYQHTAQIRYKAPNVVADVITAFNDFITAAGALFYLSSFIGAQNAAEGSNVFNEVAGDWPVTWGSGAGAPYASAQFYDWIGRSLDGRRVRFGLFGAVVSFGGDNFRMLSTENTAVDAACQVLNDAEGVFLSVNGFQPVWKSYANMGDNAYWRNKIR